MELTHFVDKNFFSRIIKLCISTSEISRRKFMDQKENKKTMQKQQQGYLQVILSVLVFFILFLVEIYLMINRHNELLIICGVGIGILICTYFFMKGILAYRVNEEYQQIDQYEALQKAGKASYLLMRKYFNEIEEQLANMDERIGVPTEEIINAQKGIAKITISRNKENADALMNSNDKLLEKVADFEEALQLLSKEMASVNQAMLDKSLKDLILKQHETIGLLKESELSIKNEILNMNLKMSMGQPVMYQSQPNMAQAQQETVRHNEPEPVSDMNPGILDDFSELEDFLREGTEQVREEEIENPMLAEVIQFAEPSVESLPSVEPLEEESVVELETEIEVEPVVDAEPVEEESIAEVEPAVEEPEIDLESVEEEPDNYGIEEPFEDSIEEVKDIPAMPDLSNPNKIMSPDEIAALLANLGN